MQIWDLFRGYEHAHGRYEVKRVNDKGKNEGRAVTHRGPLTRELWDNHILGKGPGLGVVPLMEDDTIVWGCIDIDINNIDHAELEKKIKAFKLPLVVCRSKSGGAHCFLFLKEPMDAKPIIDILSGWAASLGYGGCEVFPKQAQRYDKEEIGNWLNMPYYYADMTNRYCIKDGKPIELPEFLEYAESMQVGIKELENVPTLMAKTKRGDGDTVAVDDGGLFEEGPPCLQVLAAQGGFPDGTRNEGLFNVAVYLKKRFGDEWQDKLMDYNSKLCDPPLSLDTISTIAKSVAKKDYDYKCRKPPIASHCNRRICQRRECGVGEGAYGSERPEILDVRKYVGEPNYWYMTINGIRIQFTTDEIVSQPLFKRKVADKIGRIPRSLPQERWDRYMDELIRDCDKEYAPEDATEFWQFKTLLNTYLTGQARTVSEEQLLVSMSPYITGSGDVWFKFDGLIRHLEKQGFKVTSRSQISIWLKEAGAKSGEKSIKGKSVRLWFIPEPETLRDADEPMEFQPKKEEF